MTICLFYLGGVDLLRKTSAGFEVKDGGSGKYTYLIILIISYDYFIPS